MDMNKRGFLKLSALTASALVAERLLPQSAFAAALNPRLVSDSPYAAKAGFALPGAISFEECQSLDYNKIAERSPMVQAGWKYLLSEVDKIQDKTIRDIIAGLYADSTPKLALIDAGKRKEIWEKLKSEGYTTQSVDDFLPPDPQNMKAKYPYVSSGGSGYWSHHFYPGGLVMHVATNCMITSYMVDTYKTMYGYDVNRDVAMGAQLLHDQLKPFVFQWKADQSSRTEQTLTGTGQHHCLSAAESIVRKMPAPVVIAQTCAHNNPGDEKSEAEVVSWLKTAAIIAGVDPVAYGLLDKSGKTLPLPRNQEGFLCHVGDHDYVLSVPAVKWTTPVITEIAKADYKISDNDMKGKPFHTFRNYVYAQLSAMQLHQAYTKGEKEFRALVHSVVKPV